MTDDIIYIVECPQGFNDMSIVPKYIPPGGRVPVSPSKFNQMKMSDPTVVCVDKRIPVDSEVAKMLQEEADKKEALKQEIRERHEKDAPPRRKKGSGGRNLGALDTKRGVSQSELVHLPVTPRKSDGD